MANHVRAIMRSKKWELFGLEKNIKIFTSKQRLNEIKINQKESRKEWLQMIFSYHAKYNKGSGEEQFWTHDNHAVVSTNSLIETCLNYTHENPVRSGIVAEAEDYLYSSAKNYVEMESLIEIDVI